MTHTRRVSTLSDGDVLVILNVDSNSGKMSCKRKGGKDTYKVDAVALGNLHADEGDEFKAVVTEYGEVVRLEETL